MAESLKELLRSVADLWLRQVDICQKHKDRVFEDAARRVMAYVGKRYQRLNVQQIIEGIPQNLENQPIYLTTVNYTQAFIDIMTPYVFAKVPSLLVLPLVPQLPPDLEAPPPDPLAPELQGEVDPAKAIFTRMDQKQVELRDIDKMVAFQLQRALTWFSNLTGLVHEGKKAVMEGLGKGRGCLWITIADGPTGEIPANYADSVDNLLIDSDTVQMRDAGFIMRVVHQPCYRIAEIWGEKIENIRATGRSAMMDAIRDVPRNNPDEMPNYDNSDMGLYFEIWSQIGLGEKLFSGARGAEEGKLSEATQTAMEACGPYCHFAVMPGLDHPLGIDADKLSTLQGEALLAKLRAMLEWPVKTYANPADPWPVTCCDFKQNIENPWARPILEDALPLQEFIDCIYSGLLNQAIVGGRIILLVAAELDQAAQDAILRGKNLELVMMNQGVSSKALEELVGYLKFPEKNKEIFTILNLADRAFREITGLDPAIFGGIPRTQDRSAEATKMRQGGISRRPDDYADSVEQFMTDAAAKLMLAARMLVSSSTIAPLFREKVVDRQAQPVEDATQRSPDEMVLGDWTGFWQKYVHTDNEYIAASDCQVSVAAGSGRRRNKQLQQESSQQLYQLMGQQLYAMYEGTGEIEPFIALIRTMGNAYENTDVDAIIEKLREAVANIKAKEAAAAAAQQAAQAAMAGGAGGGVAHAEGVPGAPGTEAGQEAGGNRIPGAWQKAAAGPRPVGPIGPPPGVA
jgi:hypothetical protein